jgi:hypothetical protein
MPFIRFITANRHPDSDVPDGLFGLAYTLRDDPAVNEEDRDTLAKTLHWFEKNVATPDRFNRTTSKGFYRRKARGIAWFRDTASECVSRMHAIKEILESHGHPVTVLHEIRVGYIVYEDDVQVIAEPFADTRTGLSS